MFFQEMEEENGKQRDYYAFAEDLIHGTIHNLPEIDEEINKYLRNWDFDRIARIDLAILRLAIYEMLKRTDIPPIVSINEAIDMSKSYSIPDAKRFINLWTAPFEVPLNEVVFLQVQGRAEAIHPDLLQGIWQGWGALLRQED
jgi:transcription antitermination factor NusB